MSPTPASNRGPYRRRVTAAHVRERVSLRYLTDAPGGEVPTDVVGRLLAIDDDALLVVDREGALHVVESSRLLASRTVPPHPKLPPEPDVGTRDHPLVRHAARVLLLDRDDRVLLAGFSPRPGERVWTAPGGGLDAGEDHRSAAARELVEELGVAVDIGPWIWIRRATFPFRGVWIDQSERWYLARGRMVDLEAAPLTDVGMDVLRWWTLDELQATEEHLAPARLPEHLDDLLVHGPADTPVDVGR
jgi:8-oxo-dGTP pyrophosphatase MutT (NUDIX family)